MKRCDEIKAFKILSNLNIPLVNIIEHLLCLIARLGSSENFQMIIVLQQNILIGL